MSDEPSLTKAIGEPSGRRGPRVLFVSSHARRGGSEQHLATIAAALPRAQVAGTVLLEDGPLRGTLGVSAGPLEVLPTGAGPAGVLGSARKLRRTIRHLRPDVVHASGIKAALVSILAGGSPVVWVKHDFSWSGFLGNLVASRARLVVGVSRAVVATIPERQRAKVRVVPNALRPWPHDRKEGRRLIGELTSIDDDACVIALVGRLDPFKGHRDVLATLPRLAGAVPDPHVIFIGGDDPSHAAFAAALRREAAGSGSADRVVFTGHRDDVGLLLDGSDVVVIASRPDDRGRGAEGFGLVALEAMAAGVPIVAYEAGAVAEVLGGYGTLVAPGDIDGLADAIVTAATGGGGRETLARGRERALSFTVERMIEGMQQCYVEAYHPG